MSRQQQKRGRTGSLVPDSLFYDNRVGELSRPAFQLLMELNQQFSGYNNGNLCAAHKCLRFEWNDKTLKRAKRELLQAGLIEVTKQGVGRRPTLYSLCHLPINEIQKHKIKGETNCVKRATGKRDHYYPYRRDIPGEVKRALSDSADKRRQIEERKAKLKEKWHKEKNNSGVLTTQ
ncbi:MAG: hypothetical protein AB2731_10135 [Candidatus Thiodiazotropha sp.]